MFKTDNIIIVHRERKTEDKFEKLFKTIDKKNYGRSKIIFGVFI